MTDALSPEVLQIEQTGLKQPHRLLLEGLTIAQCAHLHEQIRNVIVLGSEVVLDLIQCEDVDTAGLQLLLAIQNDPEVSLKVHWTGWSATLAAKAERLGMASWLNAGRLLEETYHDL